MTNDQGARTAVIARERWTRSFALRAAAPALLAIGLVLRLFAPKPVAIASSVTFASATVKGATLTVVFNGPVQSDLL